MMKLVCCIDEHDDRTALSAALARVFGETRAGITLLHVVNPRIDGADRFALSPAEALAAVTRDWETRLSALAATLPGAVECIVQPMRRNEEPADAIVRIADDESADLLVLGTRRAGTFRGAFLGSVADAVLRKATCPVLIIPLRQV